MLSQLRCPWCNAKGLSHISSHLFEQAVIIYCRQCMAIRGVIPLIVTPQPSKTNLPLRCPWCNAAKTEQLKITPLGKGWLVVSCQGCGTIHGVIPLVEPKPATLPEPADIVSKPAIRPKAEPISSASPVLVSISVEDNQLLAEIGKANLEAKKAQYEIEMSRRKMAAKRAGTMYRTVVEDEGPPYCLHCRRDMETQVVPPGYKNSGKKVWVCPNKCGAWEAG